MSTTEPSQEPGDRTPVFVDASGRRRRGVSVLGYLGASAATAYLAAFGLTVGTQTVSLQPVGATLVPTPTTPDDGADDAAPDEPGEPAYVPASSGSVTAATTVGRHAAPHRERSTARHARAERAERADRADRAERAERVTKPRARLVPVRVVRVPERVVRTSTHTSTHTSTVTTTTTHETPRHAHHRHHCAPEVSDHTPTAADPATADVLDQASPVRHA